MKKAIFKKGLIIYFLFHLFLPLISKSEMENNTKKWTDTRDKKLNLIEMLQKELDSLR